MTARSLERFPVHLGNGGTAVPQPEFPRDERAMQWYTDYAARHAEDGEAGRLVSCFRFTEDWAGWEMHPAGDELVVCVEGGLTLIQELGGEQVRTSLGPGEYAVNPAGVWHTADVPDHATGFFVTPGVGTQGRSR